MADERKLIILRHAKAERPDAYDDDADRPLAQRGRADARAAGEWLAEHGHVPDLALCSTAVRTRETWLALGFPQATVVAYEPLLYTAAPGDVLDLIGAVPPDVETLLVIGHNPALSMLSAYLDPVGVTAAGLRTSGIAVHRLAGAWTAGGPGRAPLVQAHTARG